MAPSNKKQDRGGKAFTDYDEHLTKAEDRLESAAHKGEASFYEHTSGAEAQLEKAEDRLEASAHKGEASFYEHTSGAEAKLEKAEDKLDSAARKVDGR